MKLQKISIALSAACLVIGGALFTTNATRASTGTLTGSCGMIVNISHWGVPVHYGQTDGSSNNLLMLINFDAGTITGYATSVSFGANSSDDPSYTTSRDPGNITFTQSSDSVTGLYKLTPTDLTQLPELKVLPVNNGNTYLIIAGGTNRTGAGGSGMCQKV